MKSKAKVGIKTSQIQQAFMEFLESQGFKLIDVKTQSAIQKCRRKRK